MKNKGFTLIELLVVIAIIGILSSIVVASMNSARDKASDANVKSNLGGLKSQAALYYDNNGQSYGTAGTACDTAGSLFADPTIAAQINATKQNSADGTATCANSASAWVVSAPLKTGGSWCVDSNNTAASSTADTTNIRCQ